MTTQSLLVPIRVPELGPFLGKLVTRTTRTESTLPLDGHRYRLATTIIGAAGTARRLASNNERAAALAAVSRDAWLEAWEDAVSAVADELVDHLSRHLVAEAAAVKMPARRRREIIIDETEHRAITARLGTAGAGLIRVLDEIDGWATALPNATVRERAAMESWQRALTTAARRLEEAWLALEDGVDAELRRWRTVAEDIARWRRPRWPVFVTWTVAAGSATWVGLVIGGYLAAPEWFLAIWNSVFSP